MLRLINVYCLSISCRFCNTMSMEGKTHRSHMTRPFPSASAKQSHTSQPRGLLSSAKALPIIVDAFLASVLATLQPVEVEHSTTGLLSKGADLIFGIFQLATEVLVQCASCDDCIFAEAEHLGGQLRGSAFKAHFQGHHDVHGDTLFQEHGHAVAIGARGH